MAPFRCHLGSPASWSRQDFALLAWPSHADDQPFISIYTTDIQSAQGREFEQNLIWSANHANKRFNGLNSGERARIRHH